MRKVSWEQHGPVGKLWIVMVALTTLAVLMTVTQHASASDLEDGCPEELLGSGTFTDVDPGSVHAPAIECIVLYGVTTGVDDTRYGASATVTRGQMATFLFRVIGETDADLPQGDHGFLDIAGTTHEQAIAGLAAADIAQGRTTTTFAPDAGVTRAQMATFLRRAYEFITAEELPVSDDYFSDDDGNVHEDNINAVTEAGFATGVDTDRFDPDGPVRRDQMASFLARVLDRLARDGEVSVPGPAATYLSEQSDVDRSSSHLWPTESARIDTIDHARSIVTPRLSSDTRWIEYDLNRNYEEFRATIGVRDDVTADSRIQFDVIVDGQVAVSQQLGLGTSSDIAVDVSGALRVRLQATRLDGSQPRGVFGNARALEEFGRDDVDRFTSSDAGLPVLFLNEQRDVDRSSSHLWPTESARIDTIDYARSIVTPRLSSDTRWIEYDLNRNYEEFRATVGVRDDADADSRIQFDVIVDGQVAASEQVAFGSSTDVEVDLTDAMRVRLQATRLDGSLPRGVFGDARAVQDGASDG